MKQKVMDLVAFAEKAHKNRWGYVWGAGGEVYTASVAQRLHSIYKTTKYDKILPYYPDATMGW